MIARLDEFRCPQFQIVHDGDGHLLFWPGDTIGERIDPEFALSLALVKLSKERGNRNSLVERRMLPAIGKYQPATPVGPRHIDDEV